MGTAPRRVLVRIRISQRGPAARRGLLAPKRWRPYAANAAAQASAPGRAAIGWPMSVIDTRLSLAQIGKAHAYR
jgi:hypothetical protein